MAIDINGFAALRRIGKHEKAFPDIAVDARKAARALFAKQLKAKSTSLKGLRKIRRAVGGKNFSLLLDGMNDAEVAVLVARLDRHHPDRQTANPAWRRRHVNALAKADIEPIKNVAFDAAPRPIDKIKRTTKKTGKTVVEVAPAKSATPKSATPKSATPKFVASKTAATKTAATKSVSRLKSHAMAAVRRR